MTVSTLRVGRSLPRARTSDGRREVIRDAIVLGGLGALAAIVGAFWPAGLLAGFVLLASGSMELGVRALALGLPMLTVTVPTMGIWWVGAIRTRQAIRAFHASWAGRGRA
jgi:hypothetical protein